MGKYNYKLRKPRKNYTKSTKRRKTKTYQQVEEDHFHNGHIKYRRSEHRPQNKIWRKGERSPQEWINSKHKKVDSDTYRKIKAVDSYIERQRRWEIKLELAQRNGGHLVCGICGMTIKSLQAATLDHIIPVSKGGQTTVDNCQLAHLACNRHKGADYDPDKYQNQKYRR